MLFRHKLLDLLIQEEGVKSMLLHNLDLGFLDHPPKLMVHLEETVPELLAGKGAIKLTNVVLNKWLKLQEL